VLSLAYDLAVASRDGAKSAPGFDRVGRAFPAEMWPREVSYGGIVFKLGPAEEGKPNALVTRGQTIPLPAGKFTRLYLLAAAAEGDQNATFRVGNNQVDLTIQDWGGFIGQWDNRQWKRTEVQIPARTPAPGIPPDIAAQMQRPRTRVDDYGQMVGITPGFIKRSPVAWFASHRHNAEGLNEPYSYSYLYAYAIEVPAGTTTFTLPNNERVRILAATVSNERSEVKPAYPLYDTLERVR
jgi:alpha-mannosidase